MSSRRAANLIARGVADSQRIVASRKRKRAGRGKAIPKMMKHFADKAESARTPAVQTASWFDWEKWPSYVLLAYTIAWFSFASSFITS